MPNTNDNVFVEVVDTVVQDGLRKAKIDKTIRATIVEKVDSDYIVTSDNVRMTAKSLNEVEYAKNDTVLVQVSEGDYSKDKFILGKITAESEQELIANTSIEKNCVVGSSFSFISEDSSFNGSANQMQVAPFLYYKQPDYLKISIDTSAPNTDNLYGIKLSFYFGDGGQEISQVTFLSDEFTGNVYKQKDNFKQEKIIPFPIAKFNSCSISFIGYGDKNHILPDEIKNVTISSLYKKDAFFNGQTEVIYYDSIDGYSNIKWDDQLIHFYYYNTDGDIKKWEKGEQREDNVELKIYRFNPNVSDQGAGAGWQRIISRYQDNDSEDILTTLYINPKTKYFVLTNEDKKDLVVNSAKEGSSDEKLKDSNEAQLKVMDTGNIFNSEVNLFNGTLQEKFKVVYQDRVSKEFILYRDPLPEKDTAVTYPGKRCELSAAADTFYYWDKNYAVLDNINFTSKRITLSKKSDTSAIIKEVTWYVPAENTMLLVKDGILDNVEKTYIVENNKQYLDIDINRVYSQNNTRNTVICRVLFDDQYEEFCTFNFTFGTVDVETGTGYRFYFAGNNRITPDNRMLKLTPVLIDPEGNEVDLKVNNFTCSWVDGTNAGGISIDANKTVTVRVADYNKDQFLVLHGMVENLGNLSPGIESLTLHTYFPIVKTKDLGYVFEGVTQCNYDATGQRMSSPNNKPYKLITDGINELKGVVWDLWIGDEKRLDNPSLSRYGGEVSLRASEYLSASETPPQAAIKAFFSGEMIYSAPIILRKTLEGLGLLGEWNGKQKLDSDKNIIYSGAFVAGEKSADNNFTGVIVGKANLTEYEGAGNVNGILGIKNGVTQFKLDADGSVTELRTDNFTLESGSLKLYSDEEKTGSIAGWQFNDDNFFYQTEESVEFLPVLISSNTKKTIYYQDIESNEIVKSEKYGDYTRYYIEIEEKKGIIKKIYFPIEKVTNREKWEVYSRFSQVRDDPLLSPPPAGTQVLSPDKYGDYVYFKYTFSDDNEEYIFSDASPYVPSTAPSSGTRMFYHQFVIPPKYLSLSAKNEYPLIINSKEIDGVSGAKVYIQDNGSFGFGYKTYSRWAANEIHEKQIFELKIVDEPNLWDLAKTDDNLYIGANLIPSFNEMPTIGNGNFRWGQIYSTKGTIDTSDRNLKENFLDLNKYSKFFDSLQPISYNFKNGDRTHIGFVSQEVEQSLFDNNLTAMDFAGFCKDLKVDDNNNPILDEEGNEQYNYSLRYSEFIALNTDQIQKLKKRVASLEERLNILEKKENTNNEIK